MAEKNGKDHAQAKLVYPEITGEDTLLYANYVLVDHTPWDFALHFGLVTKPLYPVPSSTGVLEIPVKKLVTVNIPVPLIKGLVDALQTAVDKYEKQYGEVKVPTKGEK